MLWIFRWQFLWSRGQEEWLNSKVKVVCGTPHQLRALPPPPLEKAGWTSSCKATPHYQFDWLESPREQGRLDCGVSVRCFQRGSPQCGEHRPQDCRPWENEMGKRKAARCRHLPVCFLSAIKKVPLSHAPVTMASVQPAGLSSHGLSLL